jgi:hypothetical protein
MGVETMAAIGIGSAVAGAAKGAKGTPDQTSTTQAKIAPAGAQEQQLQSQSLQNYMQANDLAKQYEQGIGGAQGLQDQARTAGGNILNGSAFQLTPQEQQSIQAQRDALVNAGQFDINTQQTKDIGNAQADAANRGLRGQAMGALQGQVYQASQEATGRLGMQANQLAAQAAQNIPMQRIQAQSGLISQGMSLADQLRQNALINRSNLQNPALMQALQNERIQGASRTQFTPGQKGSVWDAIGGGLAGGAQGAALGANLSKGWSSLSGQGGMGYQNSGGGYTSNGDVMRMRADYMNM